jgi:hypothetical protein
MATYRKYTDKHKLEAATAHIVLGSLASAAGATKIPIDTLKSWTKQEWWRELQMELKAGQKLHVSARLQKILDKSLEIMEDRLEKGDFFYDQKKGELVRKEVGIRDAAAVAQMAFTAQNQIVTETNQVTAVESIDAKLQKLADSFASIMTEKRQNKAETITFVEEVDDK